MLWSWLTLSRHGGAVPMITYVDRRAEDLRLVIEEMGHMLQAEMDRRVQNQQREMDQRLINQQNGLVAATGAMDARLEGMNEFRAQTNDIMRMMVTQSAFTATITGITDRLTAVEAAIERQRARQAVYAASVGLVVAVVAALSLILGHIQLK